MDIKTKYEPGKAIKIILFWSNVLFVVLLSKNIISSPQGNIDFLLRNLSSFICALIITAIMLRCFPKRF
jgi:hypothetical protein